MHNYKRSISSCVIALLLITAFAANSWGASKVIEKKNGTCACDTYSSDCSIDKAIADGYDPIYVKPASTTGCPYYNPITVTSAVSIIGLNTSGKQAWTSNSAGCVSGPTIRFDSKHDHIVKIQSGDVKMMGFTIDGWVDEATALAGAVTGTAISGTVNKITLTYNTYKIGQGSNVINELESKWNKAKGVSVEDGSSAYNLYVTNCVFTGQPTNTSNWFYVGNYGSGGSVGGVKLSNNSITNSMSTLELIRPITDTLFLNNTFENSWIVSEASTVAKPYGYVLVSESTSGANNVLKGLILTHNTFGNSSVSTSYETGILVKNDVDAASVNGGNWEENFAIHDNNFLQGDAGGSYPIVGFQTGSPVTDYIAAASNWWGSTAGPRLFSASSGSTTQADVSSYVKYTPSSWPRNQITGGDYAGLSVINAIQEITGTQMLNNSMYLKVKTDGGTAATFIPTKYTSNPTVTTSGLPSSSSYSYTFFDLGIKTGTDNIGAITATFYAPYGATLPTAPLYWLDAAQSKWRALSSYMIKKDSRASQNVTVLSSDISQTSITHTLGPTVTAHLTYTANFCSSKGIYASPTLTSALHPISSLSRSFFALVRTGGSGSSTTTTASSTTTTASSSSSGTTTSSSSSSSTSTATTSSSSSSSSSGTSTSTSSVSNTTTTAAAPKLSVSPTQLDFTDNDSTKQVTISNSGSGTLSWEINDNETEYTSGENWVFAVDPTSGSVATTPQEVNITVNRKGLEGGTYTAMLPVTSTGGNRDIELTMDVATVENPIFTLSSQIVVFFNREETSKTFKINNLGTGSLTWEVEAPVLHKGEGWLTVSPSSGYARDQAEVTVTVDRDNLRPGLYSATIPIRTNAGTKNVTVAMIAYEGPVLDVSPLLLIFASASVTEKTFTISNAKAGTLEWEIGAPTYYGGSDWLTISPAYGSVETEEAAVTVTAAREGLSSGMYRATIPITSNGGSAKVNVFLFVIPFL